MLKENDKNKINIECFGTNKADLLQKIREEFNKIRTLDKAKEFIFVNNNWQLINNKLDNKNLEKSGFNAPSLFELNIENQLLLIKILEKEAKMTVYTEGSLKSELRYLLIEKGKIKDVLNHLIQHYLNDLEKQNEARLHLIRINKNEDDNNKGFINYADYKTELNRINNAVLKLINDLA